MKYSNQEIAISVLSTLVPILCVVLIYRQLPPEVPVHFALDGSVDEYMPKLFLLAFPVVLSLYDFFLLRFLNTSWSEAFITNQIVKLVFAALFPCISIFSTFVILTSVL